MDTDSHDPNRSIRIPSPIGSEDGSLLRFLDWTRSQGIWLDSRLQVRSSANGANHFAVFANQYIPPGHIVAKVAKRSILSCKTSALSLWLTPPSPQSDTAGLVLALCLVYEQCLKHESKFAPYLEILPKQQVPLPLTGVREQTLACQAGKNNTPPWCWISGTETERIDTRASLAYFGSFPNPTRYGICRERVLDYFHSTALGILRKTPLFERIPDEKELESQFIAAYTIVSSRDFIVDLYHGVGLVPISDLFNHSDSHTVHFESDDIVCADCGAKHHPHRETNRIGDEKDHHDDEDEQQQSADTVDMRILSPIFSQDQVFNTYGPLSNARLLNRYGFCLEMETELERYTWDLAFESEQSQIVSTLPEKQSLDAIFQFCSHHPISKSKWTDKLDCLWKLSSFVEEVDDDHPFLCPIASSSSKSVTSMEEELAKLDRFQPLFIDSEGRISTVLWRLYLLSSILSIETTDSKNLIERIRQIESQLSYILTQDNDDQQVELSTSDQLILSTTLCCLKTLLSQRLDDLYISHHESQALHILHNDTKPTILRSCILQAYQEFAALRVCLSNPIFSIQ